MSLAHNYQPARDESMFNTIIENRPSRAPAEEMAYYLQQAELCARHAEHYAKLAKEYADYVASLKPSSPDTGSRPLIEDAFLPSVQQAPVVAVAAAVERVSDAYPVAQTANPQALQAVQGVNHPAHVHHAANQQAPVVYQAPQQPSQTPVQHHPVAQPAVMPSQPAVTPHQPAAAAQVIARTAAFNSPFSAGQIASPQLAVATPLAFQAPAAPSISNAPAFQGPPQANEKQAVAKGGRTHFFRAVTAAGLGVLAGAALWGGVGFLTGGWEFKYGAVLIGIIVGGLASKGAGAPSKAVGVVAAVMSLISLLLGKGIFELLVHPTFTMGEHIAYHTTFIDLIFYGATVVTGFVVASSSGLVARLKGHLGRYIPALR